MTLCSHFKSPFCLLLVTVNLYRVVLHLSVVMLCLFSAVLHRFLLLFCVCLYCFVILTLFLVGTVRSLGLFSNPSMSHSIVKFQCICNIIICKCNVSAVWDVQCQHLFWWLGWYLQSEAAALCIRSESWVPALFVFVVPATVMCHSYQRHPECITSSETLRVSDWSSWDGLKKYTALKNFSLFLQNNNHSFREHFLLLHVSTDYSSGL